MGTKIANLDFSNIPLEYLSVWSAPITAIKLADGTSATIQNASPEKGTILLETFDANESSTITYSAKPAKGYTFKGWENVQGGTVDADTNNLTLDISKGNVSATAVFEGTPPTPTAVPTATPGPTAVPTTTPAPTAVPTTTPAPTATPVVKIKVALPVLVKTNYLHTGATIAPQFSGFDAATMGMDVLSATDIGAYKTIITLLDTSKYEWDTATNKNGSWAYSWHILENKPQKKVEDGNTGIVVEGMDDTTFDPSTELSIVPQSDLSTHKIAIESLDDTKELVALYDIRLLLEGKEIQPDGKVKIRLPLTPAQLALGNLRAVYIDKNGKASTIKDTVKDGYMEIIVDHFSMYGVLADKQTPAPTPTTAPTAVPTAKPAAPTTGDTENNFALWLLLGLSGCAATALLIYKKRKQ